MAMEAHAGLALRMFDLGCCATATLLNQIHSPLRACGIGLNLSPEVSQLQRY